MARMGGNGTNELLYKEEVFAIVGAAMEVHRELGAGFLESVYAEALAEELKARGIPFHREVGLEVMYKGRLLGKTFRLDFLVFDEILVELKALDSLSGRDQAQVLNYLKASGKRVGLLLNFGTHPKMEWVRLVR